MTAELFERGMTAELFERGMTAELFERGMTAVARGAGCGVPITLSLRA